MYSRMNKEHKRITNIDLLDMSLEGHPTYNNVIQGFRVTMPEDIRFM